MKLESSNKFLQSSFEWAVEKTKRFVVTGTKNGEINKGEGPRWYGPNRHITDAPTEEWAQPKDYKPAFWAGYFDRTAYYIRDYAHQAAGAYLVGLEEELYNMLYTYASNASEETGWFAPWAFNFDGSVYYMDMPSSDWFVREITAQFELVERTYTNYLWSGDKRYIENDVIFNFIEKVMTVLIDNLDGALLDEKNGIPEGFGDIWRISSTYNERGFHAVEAADSIAAMYQALIAYANILKLRGNAEESEKQFRRAEDLRAYFNNEWSVVEGTDMFAYALDNKGVKRYEWYKNGGEIHGGETVKFILYKKLSYPGERNDKLIEYIFNCEKNEKTREDNVESYTYLPDIFFTQRRPELAWFWMNHIINIKDEPHEHKSQGTNGDYPEISFTFVAHAVQGLMGVSTDAASDKLFTLPNLPEEVNDVKLTDMKFGDHLVDISVEKNSVTVKNNGKKPFIWFCGFDGNVSSELTVLPGESKTVRK